MKPAFKTTTVAILVTLGVAGCSYKSKEMNDLSYPKEGIKISKPEEPVKPVEEVKPVEPTKAAEPAKPVEEANPVEPAKPVEEAKPVEPTKPVEEVKPVEPAKPEEPALPTYTDTHKMRKVLSTVEASNLDKNKTNWRVAKVTTPKEGEQNPSLSAMYDYTSLTAKEGGLFETTTDENNNLAYVDLSELTSKKGRVSGTYSGALDDSLLNGQKLNTVDPVNYIAINQPYSSYGALFTNENDQKFFILGQRASWGHQERLGEYRGPNTHEGHNNKDNYDYDTVSNPADNYEYSVFSLKDKPLVVGEGGASNRPIEYLVISMPSYKWNDEVVGSAVYQGDVVSSIAIQQDNGVKYTLPKVDGTVELKVNIPDNQDKGTVEGSIKSSSVGTINLSSAKFGPFPRSMIETNSYVLSGARNDAAGADNPHLKGSYTTYFVGKELNDAIGNISLTNDEAKTNEIKNYQAVFGAVKRK
ncbi:hypothetical protein A1D22_02905 [Pasteurellaceae bacterium LFhippo2]|nr:hypothetical protein [Pasteurellaceae bacterium LFhippo2]